MTIIKVVPFALIQKPFMSSAVSTSHATISKLIIILPKVASRFPCIVFSQAKLNINSRSLHPLRDVQFKEFKDFVCRTTLLESKTQILVTPQQMPSQIHEIYQRMKQFAPMPSILVLLLYFGTYTGTCFRKSYVACISLGFLLNNSSRYGVETSRMQR